jgi:DNA-3-methyladenine glycosylase I
LKGDNEIFERIALEGFQAGLSWSTVLHKREAFRQAFHGFHIEKVAAMTDADVDKLLQNEQIIRNKAKIRATIQNAIVIRDMQRQGTSISDLIWSFSNRDNKKTLAETDSWIARDARSDAMAEALRARGLTFVGSTTMYAMMQAIGIINDHAPECFRRAQIAALR